MKQTKEQIQNELKVVKNNLEQAKSQHLAEIVKLEEENKKLAAKAAKSPRRGLGQFTEDTLHSAVDIIAKAASDLQLVSVFCLLSLVYMCYMILMHIVKIPADQVSVEVLGVIGTLVAGMLANIKMFVTEKQTDLADRREHSQFMEYQKMKIDTAREGLEVQFDELK